MSSIIFFIIIPIIVGLWAQMRLKAPTVNIIAFFLVAELQGGLLMIAGGRYL